MQAMREAVPSPSAAARPQPARSTASARTMDTANTARLRQVPSGLAAERLRVLIDLGTVLYDRESEELVLPKAIKQFDSENTELIEYLRKQGFKEANIKSIHKIVHTFAQSHDRRVGDYDTYRRMVDGGKGNPVLSLSSFPNLITALEDALAS